MGRLMMVVGLVMITAGAACSGGAKPGEWVVVDPAPEGVGQVVRLAGTIRHLELEGGLYVIADSTGTNFNPTNLPVAFRIDGAPVEVEARRRDDMVSIGMVGPIVDVVRIRERGNNRSQP